MFLLLISPLRKKRALHFLAIKMQNNAAGRLLCAVGAAAVLTADVHGLGVGQGEYVFQIMSTSVPDPACARAVCFLSL